MALKEYTDFCRLCQSDIGTIPIIEDNDELLQKITNITKIEMTDCYVKMPLNICSSCRQKLIDIQNFIDMVQRVDAHLRYLKGSKTCEMLFRNRDCTIENKNEEEVFKCGQCISVFPDKISLENHIITHSDTARLGSTKKYTCTVCSETFKNLSVYTTHKKLFCQAQSATGVESMRKFEDKSGRKIKKREKMVKSRIKENKNTNKIDFSVSQNFESNNGAFSDVEEPQKDNTYHCIDEGCSSIFTSPYALKIHQLNHGGNSRPFLCVTCGKDFTTRNSLSCHEKIHLDVKGYRCCMCNIDFSVRSNLRAHIRKYHEGIRFHCSQCTKQFLSKCSLERHEKLHTGIKEFKCVDCKAEFYTNKELVKHQRYHQGLKQHKCQECFKSFFERHHLVVHLRSHTGERPYVCEFPGCGKSFVESQKLKRHHKAKHIAK